MMKSDNPRPALAMLFIAISMILSAMVLLIMLGCSKPEDKYPPIKGTRTYVHKTYIQNYSMHTNQWSVEVKAAYNRDMDAAEVETK